VAPSRAVVSTLRLLLGMGAMLLWTSVCQAQTDRRVALIIGNSAYRSTAALPNPVNDAHDLAGALDEVGFTVVLLERDLDKRGMESAIAKFARLAQDADAAMFYFAGHGVQYRGQNYLMPVDAKLEDEFNLNFELTRLDDVLFVLERARGVKILVLDACRNNPLADRLSRVSSSRDAMVTRGLSRVDPARGMVIAYSTRQNQIAVDGDGRNSPFTAALIRQIREPRVEIGTMFRRVAADVSRATEGRQVPELSVSLIGEFYVNTRDTDVEAWSKIRNSRESFRLRDFLAKYPASALVPDARDRLAAIEFADAQSALRERQRLAREQAERDLQERRERERLAAEQEERARIAREQAERVAKAEAAKTAGDQATQGDRPRIALANPDGPVSSAAPAAPSRPARPAPASAPAASPPISPEEITIMVRRGNYLLQTGDIAAARLILRRAATSGNAEAAVALGKTYDPFVMAELRVVGFAPDPDEARSWYRQAAELGSSEAIARLRRLNRGN